MKRTGLWVAAALANWLWFSAWVVYLAASGREYNSLAGMERRAGRMNLDVVRPGEVVRFADERKLVYFHWAHPEERFRWTLGKRADIAFRLPPDLDTTGQYRLRLGVGGTNGTQRLEVRVNATPVARTNMTGGGELNATAPGRLLHPGVNVVELEIPDAHTAGTDYRMIGLALTYLSVAR